MSTFGSLFRITTFGESHSDSVGVVVDGCPPRMPLSSKDVQPQLNRRRPGQSHLTTSRNEEDIVTIHCGVENGLTLGTPIMMKVKNKDFIKKDYDALRNVPRPSHADFTYLKKYGINASSGGGRASARETIGRIAAGSIAEKWLDLYYGVKITAWVSSVGDIASNKSLVAQNLTREIVDENLIRCPEKETAMKMEKLVRLTKEKGDSIGGTITAVCKKMPIGLGEPVFDKLKAKLAQAMMSIPAAMGFEIGSGFEGTKMNGSQHNDLFKRGLGTEIVTSSNNSGGVQGGISNGADLVMRVAFKPVSTINLPQKTCTYDG